MAENMNIYKVATICVFTCMIGGLIMCYLLRDDLIDVPRLPKNIFMGESTSEPSSNCMKPVNHIYFLKVHKTGSSTVGNLFWRYSFINNLTNLVFPNTVASWPYKKLPSLQGLIPKSTIKGKYDIYCEHSVYDEKELMTRLHNDTINIAIVREPYVQFVSTFTYFGMARTLKLARYPYPYAVFLKNPSYFHKKFYVDRRLYQNNYAQVFGFTDKLYGGNTTKFLKYLDSKFLVLITELLPESLIIMKHQLCWSVKDILYVKIRTQSYSKPILVNHTNLLELHKAWSPDNYVYYDYFKSVMVQRIAQQSNDYHQEVAHFRRNLEITATFCKSICSKLHTMAIGNTSRSEKSKVLKETLYFGETKWDAAFDLSGYECMMMIFRSTTVYIPAERVKLYPEQCELKKPKIKIPSEFCKDHFIYTFPWSMIESPVKSKGGYFLSKCD